MILKNKNQRIIAVANQKGGVGKTTTAVNLATALSASQKKTLLIDLDPQGNATTGLGLRRSLIRTSVYDVILGSANIKEAIQKTKIRNLDIVPSSVHLSGAEVELVTSEQREKRLDKALKDFQEYDYIIIDCAPSLGLLTLNALVAAQSVIVPLQCEFYALEGLSQLVKTIERVQARFNPDLFMQGIVMTMFDRRNNLSLMVEQDVRDHFGDIVYKTVIPRNVRLSEAPSHGLPAIIYDMHCAGSKSYIAMAKEVIKQEKTLEKQAA